MILIVMYEVNSQADFAALDEAIAFAGPSSHFMASFCLVSTDQSPTDLRASLRSRLDPHANVYVAHLTQKHAEFLPPQAHTWIAEHRDASRQG